MLPNNHVPLLGQRPSREDAAKIKIQQTIEGLSLTIYSRMACDYLGALGYSHLDAEKLKLMAKNSQIAAHAYFEGLGIIKK